MDVEVFKSELEKLNKDRVSIDNRIVQLREELISLEKNKDVLIGAIQTCNYFLKLSEDSKAKNDAEKVKEELPSEKTEENV
jgi:hypothetical protein